MILDALMPRISSPGPLDPFWYTSEPSADAHSCSSVFGGSASSFPPGSSVTHESAMRLSTVFACVRVRAETLASLPLHLMETEGDSRHKAVDEHLYHVLHRQANARHTSYEFLETMEGHRILRGNAYALIVPGPGRAVDQLVPLNPARMTVFKLDEVLGPQPTVGRLGYLYRDEHGDQFRLTQDEVMHLRGLSSDGIVGLSPIQQTRRTIELTALAEDHGNLFYKNMGKPGGILQMREGVELDPDAHKRLRESWQEAHSGRDLFSVAITEDGTTWQEVGISNEDSQWLQGRILQGRLIAQTFRVPLHLIMDWENATYDNIESANLSFAIHTMLPGVVNWEQAITRDLITEPNRFFPKFAMTGLMRGDSTAQVELLKGLWGITAINGNEIRELFDRNPYPGGETYYAPVNFAPVGTVPVASQTEDVARQARVQAPGEDATAEQDRVAGQVVMAKWRADVSKKIAAAEVGELGRRASKAAGDRSAFNQWVAEFWRGPHHRFVERGVSPLVDEDEQPGMRSAALADAICATATQALLRNDPTAVLERWKATRPQEIETILAGEQRYE